MNDKNASIVELVSTYLLDNPDFLLRNPHILEALDLNHEAGGAVSLIEKQVDTLREQNRKLNQKLDQLVQVASENEQLMSRLHRLTLELMATDDLGEFFDHLSRALLEEFNADILNISLLDREVATDETTPLFSVRRDEPDLQQFQSHLDKGETVCGRLNRNKLDFLFGQRAQWVQSTALIPLGDDGLMAVGSSDPARFYPGMGTLFLDLLATVVTSRLATEEPRAQRRSA